jgi:phage terminase large subunit GpA-like protein
MSRYRNAARKLLRSAFKLFRPPEDVTITEWAEKYRVMPKGVTGKPGPYRAANAPYQRETQDDFLNPDVQVHVLMWASRVGKTECLLNLQGERIHNNPCSMLVVYPTLDSIKNWSKKFFAPMVRATKVLKKLISSPREKDADNTILSKAYPGGTISGIGTNSPSGFRQIQAPVVICDEIDAMENGKEGDPITLAFRRADNYNNSIQILSSTPTEKGNSRIEEWYEKGDKQKWFCTCPKCGHGQELKWKQVDFGAYGFGTREDPRYICEGCSKPLTDEERIEMIENGRWVATAPFNGIRSRFLPGLYNTFPPKRGFKNRLHQFVSEFLEAKDDPEKLRVWTNTFLCETYEEDYDKIEQHDIENRAERYEDLIPSKVRILSVGGDIQKDRIEVLLDGWAYEHERFAIEHKIFWGNTEEDEVWNELDSYLSQHFLHPSGKMMKIDCGCIDMGHDQDRVLTFLRKFIPKKILPCKGINVAGPNPPPILPGRPSKNNKQKLPFWPVGVTEAKKTIYARLGMEPGGPRTMHYPLGRGFDSEYYKQLTIEKAKTRFKNGRPYKIFEPPSTSSKNEAIDLSVYSLAAVLSLGYINWEKVDLNFSRTVAKQKEKAEKVEEAKGPPSKEAKKVVRDMRKSRGRTSVKRGNSRSQWIKNY